MEDTNGAFLDLVPPSHQQCSQPHRPKLRNITFNPYFFADGKICCHICIETFQIDEEIASHETCMQLWHADCFKLWMQYGDTCTGCREMIKDRNPQPQTVCKHNDGVYRDLIIAFNRTEAEVRRQTIQHRQQVKYLSGLEQFLQKRIELGISFDFVMFGPHPGNHPDSFDELIGTLGVLAEYVSGCRCCKRRLVSLVRRKRDGLVRSWHEYSVDARREEKGGTTVTEMSWSETSLPTTSS